jgi:hypothetical protein
LGRSIADAVKPTIERILNNAAIPPEGVIKELKAADIIKELQGEAFLDDVSSFANSDIEEILFYRNLAHARIRWSAWAKKISRGVFALMIVQGLFTFYFVTEKILDRIVTLPILLITFLISAAIVGFCITCAGVMLRYHEQISDYRDKVL